jgi:hypothetical protein
MRLGIFKDIDWPYVGALLANSDDEEQAAFFKGFLKECSSWGTHFQVEQQLAHVNHKLTPEERRTLSMLSYNEGDS